MEVTNHAIERYCERVLKVEDADIKAFLTQEKKEEIKLKLSEIFERTKFVYSGKYNDNAISNFYLNEDLLLVTNKTSEAILTLYYVEFGFAKGTNKKIIEDLMEEINGLYYERDDLQPTIDSNVYEIDTQLLLRTIEIQSLNNRIKILEEDKKMLEMQKKTTLASIDSISEKIYVLASKICYSVNYKLDMLRKK